MSKIAVISYHKNLPTFCSLVWVAEYKRSILDQTYKDFDLWEVDYGANNERIFENSIFESKEFPTFVHCMNYMLDKIFALGYDFIFNTNSDDLYATNRIEKQLPFLEIGFDLVSSNFALVRDGITFHYHNFNTNTIRRELERGENPICHPVVAYSKRFWEQNRYDPDQIPTEDLELWRRAIKNSKFIILPDILLYQNLHSNSVCQNENNR